MLSNENWTILLLINYTESYLQKTFGIFSNNFRTQYEERSGWCFRKHNIWLITFFERSSKGAISNSGKSNARIQLNPCLTFTLLLRHYKYILKIKYWCRSRCASFSSTMFSFAYSWSHVPSVVWLVVFGLCADLVPTNRLNAFLLFITSQIFKICLLK